VITIKKEVRKLEKRTAMYRPEEYETERQPLTQQETAEWDWTMGILIFAVLISILYYFSLLY